MPTPPPALSYTGLFILQALAQGHRFGFDIMEVTALPSGTIYPALRRLEALVLVTSDWENDVKARTEGRPRRRYSSSHRPVSVSSVRPKQGSVQSIVCSRSGARRERSIARAADCGILDHRSARRTRAMA